jgi:AraC-like DNA-binding protein
MTQAEDTSPAPAHGTALEPWTMVDERRKGSWPLEMGGPEIMLPAHFGEGKVSSVVMHGGFQCCLVEADLRRAGTVHASDPSPPADNVAFACALVVEGGAAISPAGIGEPATIRAGDFVVHHSAEPRMDVQLPPSRLMFFNAGFSVELLRGLVGDLRLPPPLRRIMETGGGDPFVLPGRLDGRARTLMEEIRRAPYTQAALRLHHQAKALELLAHVVHLWSDERPAARHRWTQRDIERLHDARRLLLRDLEAPPTLTELSALIGISPTKLKLGFREVFDATVSDTLREARLQAARELLTGGEFPLKVVAHRVGFCDAPSLSHAFKARFGVSPGRLRR